MGWETNLFCTLTYNRDTFNYKGEVLHKLEEIEDTIKDCKKTLHNLAIMTEPNKFFDKEDGSILFQIENRVEESLELLEDCYVEQFKLNVLLNNWEYCHKDGLAIAPPSDIKGNTAYLDGDFVNTVQSPNKNKEL